MLVKILIRAAAFSAMLIEVSFGQAVVVQNVYLSPPATMVRTGPFDWTDYPSVERTLTVPSGTAVITWSFFNVGVGNTDFVRPVVAGLTPPVDAIGPTSTPVHGGSWVTHVDAGEISVKFQVSSTQNSGASFNTNNDSVSYTFMVFPDAAPGNAPAVSLLGLGVMLVGMLGVGAVVIRRRSLA